MPEDSLRDAAAGLTVAVRVHGMRHAAVSLPIPDQALGHGVLSLIVSVARQLVVLLPIAFVLARIGGLNAVWWAFPIAEIASVVLCACFLRRVYRAEIHSLNGTPSPDGETTATQP